MLNLFKLVRAIFLARKQRLAIQIMREDCALAVLRAESKRENQSMQEAVDQKDWDSFHLLLRLQTIRLYCNGIYPDEKVELARAAMKREKEKAA